MSAHYHDVYYNGIPMARYIHNHEDECYDEKGNRVDPENHAHKKHLELEIKFRQMESSAVNNAE